MKLTNNYVSLFIALKMSGFQYKFFFLQWFGIQEMPLESTLDEWNTRRPPPPLFIIWCQSPQILCFPSQQPSVGGSPFSPGRYPTSVAMLQYHTKIGMVVSDKAGESQTSHYNWGVPPFRVAINRQHRATGLAFSRQCRLPYYMQRPFNEFG